MRRVALCLLLAGCGPVLLGEEDSTQELGMDGDAAMQTPMEDASHGMVGSGDAGPPPEVSVRIRPLDCGTCFDLQAEGSGGQPPYDFQWEDGSFRPQRRVCITGTASYSVIAFDAARSQSQPHVIHLESASDVECPPIMEPIDAGAPAELCLENPSFEGTPAVNFGDTTTFDALPWNACTNPMWNNTPDVANDTIAVTNVPAPTDGLTYLALGEGEQVSQPLCSELDGSAPVYFRLDLARVDLGTAEAEQVFLEVWGGLAVDCSQRELLWASPALQAGWQNYCITLQPRSFMTQLTLRANADMTSLNPAYLLADNLQPVDACP